MLAGAGGFVRRGSCVTASIFSYYLTHGEAQGAVQQAEHALPPVGHPWQCNLCEMKQVTIYTDGSSRGNPGPGGYGTLLLSGKHRRELSGGFRCTTNNRMEILAAIIGLEALNQPCEVTVISDSKYLVNAMTKGWAKQWKQWRWAKKGNKPLKNADLWKRLDDATQPHKITWKWVKGHAGNAHNECCDVLATKAADTLDNPIDQGYQDTPPPPELF